MLNAHSKSAAAFFWLDEPLYTENVTFITSFVTLPNEAVEAQNERHYPRN
jgi:hypothetical protein